MRYAVITPAKNEADYIGATITSMVNQSLRPVVWIIVDDASVDATADIVRTFSHAESWITLLSYQGLAGERAGGQKVVRLFNYGLDHLPRSAFDFIVKLDADVDLPPNYFAVVAKCFEAEPDVGLCGGRLVEMHDGERVQEQVAEYHVRGAFKAYRWACFNAIGGLPLTHNWDGLDEMTAMSMGWKIRVLPVDAVHLRPTGTETNAGLRSAFRSGREYYRDGNDLLIAACRSAALAVRTPPLALSGIAFLLGFMKAQLLGEPKNVDAFLQRFVRTFQYRRIIRLLAKPFRRNVP